MPLLYYWRGDNYRRDLDVGAGYHLNQANPLLHEVEVGDSLWAFTRRPDRIYVLAAELVIAAKTVNPPDYPYGRYRVWGNLISSRYFAIDDQSDITSLVRRLSISASGEILGRAFQGRSAVRRITKEDHMILSQYSRSLPLEPRAHLLPEERLEALMQAGDSNGVEALLHETPAGVSEPRRHYLTSKAIQRDRSLVDHLRSLYSGRCQLCGWAPRARYGVELCEAHHVRWLSRGGMDVLSNMILACPNHHRAIHRCDAPFDAEAGAFVFATQHERLILVDHEVAPN